MANAKKKLVTGDKVMISMPEAMVSRIDNAAEKRYMRRSEWIRSACIEKLNRENPEVSKDAT